MWGLGKQPAVNSAPLEALADSEYSVFESTTADTDGWLLSFVDLLTLLLTLFVLLLAYQQGSERLTPTLQSNVTSPALSIAADPAPVPVPTPAPAPATVPVPLQLATHVPEEPAVSTQTPATIESATQASLNPEPEGELKAVGLEAAELESIEFETTELAATTISLPAQPQAVTTAAQIEDVDEGLSTGDASAGDYLQQFAQLDTAVSAPPDWLQPLRLASQHPLPMPVDPFSALLAQLDAAALSDRVSIQRDSDQLQLEISDSILFEPASAALTGHGMALLDRLLPVLLREGYHLSVEGHTDNRPIQTPRFPSNWELSAARAAQAARHLIAAGLSAQRVRTIGYADTRPRADNSSDAGRARNRRVSFVLRPEST